MIAIEKKLPGQGQSVHSVHKRYSATSAKPTAEDRIRCTAHCGHCWLQRLVDGLRAHDRQRKAFSASLHANRSIGCAYVTNDASSDECSLSAWTCAKYACMRSSRGRRSTPSAVLSMSPLACAATRSLWQGVPINPAFRLLLVVALRANPANTLNRNSCSA